MKALSASLLTLALAAMPLMASTADEKVLQNLKGSVTYGPQQNPTTPLAKNASQPLADNDYAATGANSEAAITLPDSSRLLMGQNSSVQLVQFNQTDIAHAKFAVIGKVRFTVQHPNGAQADYTFQTSTGQIAVRGTEGDFNAPQTGGLQVNVYSVSNPQLPVQVTLANGQVFTLTAGQALVVTAAAGALVGAVSAVSNSLFTPFSEFGAPANASSMGIATTTTAAGTGTAGAAGAAASTGVATTAAAAAVVGTGIAASVVTSNQNNPTPAPSTQPSSQPTLSPSPQPSSTSVPIVISGKGNNGNAAPKPPVAAPGVPGPESQIHPGARPSPLPN